MLNKAKFFVLLAIVMQLFCVSVYAAPAGVDAEDAYDFADSVNTKANNNATAITGLRNDVDALTPKVNTATTNADQAKTTANEAKGTADQAKNTADAAKAAANQAKNTADAAKAAADGTSSTAISAKDTADDAKATAYSAKSAVDNVESRLDDDETRLDDAERALAIHENRISANERKISSNRQAIQQHTKQLENHEERITANTAAIRNEVVERKAEDARIEQKVDRNTQAISDLGSRVEAIDRKVDKGIAMAIANANLKLPSYDPSRKWSIALGWGNFGGQNAIAGAISYQANANVAVSLSISECDGETGMGASVTMRL